MGLTDEAGYFCAIEFHLKRERRTRLPRRLPDRSNRLIERLQRLHGVSRENLHFAAEQERIGRVLRGNLRRVRLYRAVCEKQHHRLIAALRNDIIHCEIQDDGLGIAGIDQCRQRIRDVSSGVAGVVVVAGGQIGAGGLRQHQPVHANPGRCGSSG